MPINGSEFENIIEPFFKEIFIELNYNVLQVVNQRSGTQDGFDISVHFIDDNGIEQGFFFECKYYSKSNLYWNDIFNKQMQIDASNYKPTAFVLLSPLRNLSNVERDIQEKGTYEFNLPVDFWTPNKGVNDLFALDSEVYEKVFDEKCPDNIDREAILKKIKTLIEILIQKRLALKFSNEIKIDEYEKLPLEEEKFRTTLDEKLNSVFDEDDKERIEYHKLRANYKVYLEELQDNNSELRQKILDWQSDLRVKAKRLTHKFTIDPSYSSAKFYHEFFDIAEKEILTFYKDYELIGHKEKLLHGVVFELAAECPLDWRK